ncbi:TLD domain-containing protein 1 [Acipenser ruthenus]|uniref:TLD domain-containing protein 1 n=1 Tax=Acipenser ruthenus TaxID=7906 RepID=A0A444U2Y0_ACIRT|nr:TLD domain-containing protein 1 [Acipenser ruthenus]
MRTITSIHLQPQNESKTKKSILDADPEVQALMEMTGKVRQSEGLWEPVEEEEEADK